MAYASEVGLTHVVKMLVAQSPKHLNAFTELRYDYNWSHENMTPLQIAARAGHVDVVTFLTSLSDVQLNVSSCSGYTAMHYAVMQGHARVVNALALLPNIKTHATNKYGESLMHLACRRGGHMDVLRILAALPNVDLLLNTYDCAGRKPIHVATSRGNAEFVIFLLSLPNVDVNAEDKDGCTPLYLAARKGFIDIVKHLVSLPSIDVNATSSDFLERSPLHMAAEEGHLDIVKCLVAVPSIDLGMRSRDNIYHDQSPRGWTASKLARHRGHRSVYEFLEGVYSKRQRQRERRMRVLRNACSMM